jgi:hypothetical protein
MRYKHVVILVTAAILSGCAPALQAQGAGTCRPADQSSALVQSEITSIATGVDSLSKAARDTSGIPATTSSKISLVTDSRICDKAVQAVNTLLGTSGLARRVYVIKIDVSFGVVDPELANAPGTSALFIFDRKWTHKDTMLN